MLAENYLLGHCRLHQQAQHLNATVANLGLTPALLLLLLQVADYCSDPLVYRGATAVSTAFQMGEAMFALCAVRHRLELPLYALHCTGDHITPYKVRHGLLCGRQLRCRPDATAVHVHSRSSSC